MQLESYEKLTELIEIYGPPRRTENFLSKTRLSFYLDDSRVVLDLYLNGGPKNIRYFDGSLLHRLPAEGPADIEWNEAGIKIAQYFFMKGKHHRPPSDGPAVERWYDNGNKLSVSYHLEHKLSRPWQEGPAYIEWDSSQREVFYRYSEAGLTHRPVKEGPAVLDSMYSIHRFSFYEHGRYISQQEAEVLSAVSILEKEVKAI
jgi:hypothetical protein